MIDKGLDRTLVGFFGITGMALLIFAGTQRMPFDNRLGAIAFGLVGLVWVLVRILSWRSRYAKKDAS
jgi:hypothetical protein